MTELPVWKWTETVEGKGGEEGEEIMVKRWEIITINCDITPYLKLFRVSDL